MLTYDLFYAAAMMLSSSHHPTPHQRFRVLSASEVLEAQEQLPGLELQGPVWMENAKEAPTIANSQVSQVGNATGACLLQLIHLNT